jgi:sulfonate dioxygenase
MVDKVTLPLYPHYLPTRPEGFTPTIDIPQFDIVEPGSRANPDKPEIFTSKANITKITPRCGTEIRGVQISSLSKNGLDQVALLAAERGVLVFVSLEK